MSFFLGFFYPVQGKVVSAMGRFLSEDILVTNYSVEQSPSEANSFSASREIPLMFWKPKIL
jgi:hypothetical protein